MLHIRCDWEVGTGHGRSEVAEGDIVAASKSHYISCALHTKNSFFPSPVAHHGKWGLWDVRRTNVSAPFEERFIYLLCTQQYSAK